MARSPYSASPKPRPVPANTSLSALVSSERPLHSNAPSTPSTSPGRPRVPRSLPKLVALGASVAACVVFGLALRERGSSTVERSVLHGAPGVKLSKSGAEVRWHARKNKVTIDASVEKLGEGAVSAVQSAFGTWLGSDPKLPDLTFDTVRGARVELKPDGKNTVLVAPITVPGHERDLAITLTYSDENTGAIVEADIIINSTQTFRVLTKDEGDDESSGAHKGAGDKQRPLSCSTGGVVVNSCRDEAYDLQNVLTHEVGHFFGLGEEMSDGSATMYYCTSRCETHKRALASVDSDSISNLYLAALEDDNTGSET
ncbi:MAG TPA: matrixin family metalloprotease, partial [Polyangiaceae bacterium]|nr:matrixin family metalloprotease [Polyangiaceae bacterium]